MTNLTLEQRMTALEERARERAAERHFFNEAQPFFPLGFSVNYRNPGHWDIYASQPPGRDKAWMAAHPGGQISPMDSGLERERAFRIRGKPGGVEVFDERWNPYQPYPRDTRRFRSVMGAMLWIMEELMQEPN